MKIVAQKRYQESNLYLTYRGNPYQLSVMSLLPYDLGDENPKPQEREVLFANSQVLVSKYIVGIAHINVTPKAAPESIKRGHRSTCPGSHYGSEI